MIKKKLQTIIFAVFYLMRLTLFGQQTLHTNFALHLDGKDNDLRTGIGIIKVPWTLEAWIKRGDTLKEKTEVIIGGGEYSNLNIADNLPLVIEQGRLHNRGANLWSKNVLDNKWHHVAISCDLNGTRLYLDGNIVDSSKISLAIIPGALGINDNDSTIFNGLMDEVCIWHSALSEHTLKDWMNRTLSPNHPNFKTLIAYYNFDDGMEDASINWVGKGDQSYHLRNGRYNYKGKAPLAYTVINDNPLFSNRIRQQELFNAIVVNNEWDADKGTRGEQILKLRIAVTGTVDPLSLQAINFDLSKMSRLSDISRLHIYYTGKTARSNVRMELFGNGKSPAKKMIFKNSGKKLFLTPGINYFLVTADIAKNAVDGDSIKISVPSFKLRDQFCKPETGGDPVVQTITENSKNNSDIIRVLQWNIWHGGVHLGDQGIDRIIELIQASHADIITMQEAYGSQKHIADSLGYFMHTVSYKDNLALYSCYPINAIPVTYHTFNSNPVMISLPNKKQLLINDCWLRYASEPEYTSIYPDTGLNPKQWMSADSALGLVDMQNIIEKDTKPYTKNRNIPVIIGGDFNSCSHLDWTKAAAPLHYGYGPVAFPISRYLLSEGYKDSFREMNPNEVAHPEGTWAAIYGQSQHCRIDFLYYKGNNIKVKASKIIKTSPEIDDVWASDHAAVLTTFELKGAE